MDITKARATMEKRIIADYNKMDESKYNGEQYKKYVRSLSDKAFIDYAKGLADYTFDTHLIYEDNISNNNKYKKSYADYFAIADELEVPLRQRIIYTDDDGTKYAGPNKAIVLPILVRVMQQLADKKNNASSDVDDLNMLTGQPANDSRAAAFTNAQHFSLLASNQHKARKEFMVYRSDNEPATLFMLDQIERTGNFKTDDFKHSVGKMQSLTTANVFLLSAGIKTDMTAGPKLQKNEDD